MIATDQDFIWHPFTQMKTATPPIHIAKAKDCTLYAKDGSTYIDAISSWWVNIHGHANTKIADAVAAQAQQLEQVIFAGFTHQPAKDLAAMLIGMLGQPFSKVFFSDNGSTAVEVALKMAIQFWFNKGIKHKTKIIAFTHAYHGDTFGAMSAGARSAFSAAFDGHLFSVHHINAPTAENIEAVCNQFEQLSQGDDIAAFIFEPLIQGSGGMLMHEPEYLDQLLALAKEKNILTISDEVMTGFGRTAKNFATEYLQNKPDIICLSKGITGGFLPLGVTSCSQTIFDAFYDDDLYKTFFHGHSYTGNPLSCAAANASMEILNSENCQKQIATIVESHQSFAAILQTLPFTKNIRQRGTIIAFDLDTGENTSYFNTIRNKAYHFFLEQGVLLRPLGNTIYIMPPYCITTEELQKVYDAITQFIHYLKELN